MIRRQGGQTIIEVVLAAGVILMSLSVMVAAVVSALANNRAAKERAIAVRLGQEAVEWLRQERDEANWLGFTSNFNNNTLGDYDTYCLITLPDLSAGDTLTVGDCGSSTFTESSTAYQRELDANFVSVGAGDDVFNAVIRVKWSDGGNARNVELVTQLRDI